MAIERITTFVYPRLERKLQLWRGQMLRLAGAQAGPRFGIGPAVRIFPPNCIKAGHDVTFVGSSYISAERAGSVHIGNHTNLQVGLWLNCTGSGFVQIGDYCLIQPYGILGVGAGRLIIGNHVTMGQMVNIHPGNHSFVDPNLRINEQPVTYKGIVIEDDCWIGAQAVILDGVKIGQGSVVGAGSLVTHDVPAYSVVAGNPARIIKMRNRV